MVSPSSCEGGLSSSLLHSLGAALASAGFANTIAGPWWEGTGTLKRHPPPPAAHSRQPHTCYHHLGACNLLSSELYLIHANA